MQDRDHVSPRTTRYALRIALFAVLLVLMAAAAACGGEDEEDEGAPAGDGGAAAEVGSATSGADIDLADLEACAKEEGTLNTIALPPDWANYGEIMKTFGDKYDIEVVNASPNASSAEENEAVKALKGQDRAPDVLDVGPAFAEEGKADGLYAEYMVSTWDSIPEEMKDPDGMWVGDYWGVVAFGVNKAVVDNVPMSWDDLKKPEYKGKVALNGDPRESGSALAAVFAAALANGGSLDDIQPGIDFFAELKQNGNFIPVDATPATVASGQTPVTIDWDYLQIAYGQEFEANIEWVVQVPEEGVFGNYYAQAINKDAPHPCAARLWQEFLYSAEGQNLWLKGYSHPARFQDLEESGELDEAALEALPPAQSYEDVQFPNNEQAEAAKALIAEQWGPKVAGG
jgi:putative spermidine/putrescine transport system substrate-binding protein